MQRKIEDDKERLAEIEAGDIRERSKSIVRFSKTGSRISPEEMLEGLKQDLIARIAADEHEIQQIENAVAAIEDDAYCMVVYNRFILCETDEEIAEQIPCDPSTVRRNRGRLIRKLAVRLYGVDAI